MVCFSCISLQGQIELCNNGIDDDFDGFVDCDDDDCLYDRKDETFPIYGVCVPCLYDTLAYIDEVIEYVIREPILTLADSLYDPYDATGIPEYLDWVLRGLYADYMGFGRKGHVSLKFTDNILINSGDSLPDLWVFEASSRTGVNLAIRPIDQFTKTQLLNQGLADTGDGFYNIGNYLHSVRDVDLDLIMPGYDYGVLRFDAIKISRHSEQTGDREAGINAVCASSTIYLENCGNGKDDDGDGLVDCEDGDCPKDYSTFCLSCHDDPTSFIDTIHSFRIGCEEDIHDLVKSPSTIKWKPDYFSRDPGPGAGYFCTGNGGEISGGFTDNILTNSGDDRPDVWVFEVKPPYDTFSVHLHPLDLETRLILDYHGIEDKDGDGYFDFDTIVGPHSYLDVDKYLDRAPGAEQLYFDRVKIKGLPKTFLYEKGGQETGPNIDAICAVSSVDEVCNLSALSGTPETLSLEVSGSHCDETLSLSINDTFNKYQWYHNDSLLIGETKDSLKLSGESLPGDYRIVVRNEEDCEYSLAYFLEPVKESIQSEVEICEGESYVFFDRELEEEGRYVDTISVSTLCDSIYTIDLIIHNQYDTMISALLCPGETLTYGGETISTSGIHSIILKTEVGCDSTLRIDVKDAAGPYDLSLPESFSIVAGEQLNYELPMGENLSYQWFLEEMLISEESDLMLDSVFSSGNIELVITDANGCAHTYNSNLILQKASLIYLPNIIRLSSDEPFIPGFNKVVSFIDMFEVYDRWGGLMHSYSGPVDNFLWDPSTKTVAQGVYTVAVGLILQNGETYKEVGSLLILD